MPYIAKIETVESRVKRDFGMDFLSFAQQCKNQGLGAHDVAEMIGCSLSNCTFDTQAFASQNMSA